MMKRVKPIQLMGILTVGVFAFFVSMQHSIPLFRRLTLAQTIAFFGIMMITALISGIVSYRLTDASFRKTFGILNLIISAVWGIMIYGILTFPAQQ